MNASTPLSRQPETAASPTSKELAPANPATILKEAQLLRDTLRNAPHFVGISGRGDNLIASLNAAGLEEIAVSAERAMFAFDDDRPTTAWVEMTAICEDIEKAGAL